ncbi:MAG: hypothetical protein OXU94_01095 [Gammaproteobacteria bacterium]|nr:hypothetical protein [Gammaproteobacteria bacterium]
MEQIVEQIANKPLSKLLALHVAIKDELRKRGVLRSENSPTGDLAEYLFCKAFGWKQAPNSEKGFDATGDDGKRYQIKGLRLHRRKKSRQLSAIRSLKGFDTLAAVLFSHNYKVMRAALIPVKVVRCYAKYIKHTNSHKFLLQDKVWGMCGVIDVTENLRRVERDEY